MVTLRDANTNDDMFRLVNDCVVTLHDAYTNDEQPQFPVSVGNSKVLLDGPDDFMTETFGLPTDLSSAASTRQGMSGPTSSWEGRDAQQRPL